MTGENGLTLQESFDLEAQVRVYIHQISALNVATVKLLSKLSTLSFQFPQERSEAVSIICRGWREAMKTLSANLSFTQIDGR